MPAHLFTYVQAKALKKSWKEVKLYYHFQYKIADW